MALSCRGLPLFGIPGGLFASSFMIVGNNKAIDNLTPSQQGGAAEGERGARSALFGKAWDAADDAGRNDAKQHGNVIETIAPAELDQWRPMLQFVTDEWLKKAAGEGTRWAEDADDLKVMIKAASS